MQTAGLHAGKVNEVKIVVKCFNRDSLSLNFKSSESLV